MDRVYKITAGTEVFIRDDISIEVEVKITNIQTSDKIVEMFDNWLRDVTKDTAIVIADNIEEALVMLETLNDKEEPKEDEGLINPVDMLDNKYADMCFQQYSNGNPQKWFYMNCGRGEESVVCVWYDDEENVYRFSADDKASLVSLNSHVKCKVVDYNVVEMAVTANSAKQDKEPKGYCGN